MKSDIRKTMNKKMEEHLKNVDNHNDLQGPTDPSNFFSNKDCDSFDNYEGPFSMGMND